MRVVFIGGWFHGKGDDFHLRELSREVELIVYGHQVGGQNGTVRAAADHQDLCDFCAFRELEPVYPRVPRGPRLWYYRQLGHALDEDRPDVLHVLTEPWQLLALQASRWASRHPETALVMHNSDRNWWTVRRGRRFGRRLIARRTFSRADGFVSESTGGVREALELGVANGAVTQAVIMNPRSPSLFRPPVDGAERRAAREQLGLPLEGTGVAYLGRLSVEKGPLLFLEAFGQAASLSSAPLWAAVAGTGPQEAEVAAKAGPHVFLLGAVKYPDDVATLLQAVDMLAMPSVRVGQWEEQAPRAVVEAMLSGCLVVGTPVGGIPEMLGKTGIVVADQTPAALADGIVRAASDPEVASLRASARTRAIEVYSSESAANALLQVWEQALDTRRKAA